jgi:hypothetical protein
MDMTTLVLAAIGGGVAALLGLAAKSLLPAPERTFGLRLGNLLAIGLTLTGARFAPPLLEPMIGNQVRAMMAADEGGARRAGDEVAALFENEPLLIALAEADPQAMDHMRQAVEEAYREGGRVAARSRSQEMGRELGEQAVRVYGVRTSDAALRRYFVATRAWGETLRTNPQRCYAIFYARVSSTPTSTSDLVSAATGTDLSPLMSAMVDVVREAGDEAVTVDPARVQVAQQALGVLLLESYTARDLRFMLGAVPQNAEEMQLACDTMLTGLDLMLASEDSATLLRAALTTF